jgi:cytochrome c553
MAFAFSRHRQRREVEAMMPGPVNIRIAAAWFGVSLAVLLLAGVLFVLSGLYSVAASRGHFPWTSKLLEIAMHRSVATHSWFVEPPPNLDDPELIRLGAGHFHGGCAPCHGAPRERSNPIVDRMLPPPPPLHDVSNVWSDKELFWIVQNGIKYTGMPAWVALARNDEVWALVAFLRVLPTMAAADYQELTRSRETVRDRSASEMARYGAESRAISICVRCHGSDTTPPVSRLVPVIAGQSAAYLENALRQYANGRRGSGIMQPAVAQLDDKAISQLVQYYAGLTPRQVRESSASQEQVLRGQEIATLGLPDKGIPPCLTCHAGNTATFPKLAGQHAPYIASQLRLWQRGLRASTAHGAIMAPIAKRLSDEQIIDVAAFFGSQGSATTSESKISERSAP